MALQCLWWSEPRLCSWVTSELAPEEAVGPLWSREEEGCKASSPAAEPGHGSEVGTNQRSPVWTNCSVLKINEFNGMDVRCTVPAGLSENRRGHV